MEMLPLGGQLKIKSSFFQCKIIRANEVISEHHLIKSSSEIQVWNVKDHASMLQ